MAVFYFKTDDVAPVVKSAEELALGELVSDSKRIYSAAVNVDTRTLNRVVTFNLRPAWYLIFLWRPSDFFIELACWML